MGALRDFRKVRALNVDDLEAWLECAPQTTVWLRELMGEPVAGISLLSSWWAQWLDSASPALDSGIVLAGRQREAGKLRDRCGQRRGGAITVGGRMHRDEIIAFVAAVLAPPDGSDSPADVLYVEDHGSAPRLLAAEAAAAADSRRPPLTVLVPSAEFARHLPAGSRHRMIVAVPGASQAEVVLGPVDSEHAAQMFEASGVEHAEARRLGSLARMSLMAVRRTLAKQPDRADMARGGRSPAAIGGGRTGGGPAESSKLPVGPTRLRRGDVRGPAIRRGEHPRTVAAPAGTGSAGGSSMVARSHGPCG